jgi:hypothetical protein
MDRSERESQLYTLNFSSTGMDNEAADRLKRDLQLMIRNSLRTGTDNEAGNSRNEER